MTGRGTTFLDAAGNAYINLPPVRVWVKGQRPVHLEILPADTGRAFRPAALPPEPVPGKAVVPTFAALDQ